MNQIPSRFNHQPKNRQQSTYDATDITSLKGWMRKLEQSNGSLSSRLLAVENRLSFLPNQYTSLSSHQYHDIPLYQIDEYQANKLNTSSQDHIIEQLQTMNEELLQLKEQITQYENLIADVEEQKQQLRSHLKDMESQYRKHAFIMKVHGREIPLEITGIIGGVLAFLIAALILFGGKDIIMTPLFLGLIGIIFIGSSIFRTLHKQSFIQNIFKRKTIDQQT